MRVKPQPHWHALCVTPYLHGEACPTRRAQYVTLVFRNVRWCFYAFSVHWSGSVLGMKAPAFQEGGEQERARDA